MLQSIDKKNRLFLYIFLFFLLSTINNKSLVNNHTDYVVNDFLISGLSDKDNHKIANDLKTSLLQNIFFIDKKKFSEILYSNNLVHSFKAKKIYPNIIRVDIKKTDYFAIINSNNQKFFIGSNAKLIRVNGSKKQLPFIFGKIDYKKFLEFKKIIDESKFKYNKISSIYYYPSDRWDIKTKDDLLIKLPEKHLSNALRIAYKIKNDAQFKMKKIIDLRITDQVIVSE